MYTKCGTLEEKERKTRIYTVMCTEKSGQKTLSVLFSRQGSSKEEQKTSVMHCFMLFGFDQIFKEKEEIYFKNRTENLIVS
jgi:hypothetical protein